jgi:hypothetical protein
VLIPAPAYELLVTLVTKLLLPVVGSGKPHIVLVVQGSVMVAELWQDWETGVSNFCVQMKVCVVKVTYAAAIGGDRRECVVAYAAEAVDYDRCLAGVDGLRAGAGW